MIVSDLTYVRVQNKWHYICVFIDLYNREIIGYSAGPNKNAQLVYQALATKINSYALMIILGLTDNELGKLSRRFVGIKEGELLETLDLETAKNHKYIIAKDTYYNAFFAYQSFCYKNRLPLLCIEPRRKKAIINIEFHGNGTSDYYHYCYPTIEIIKNYLSRKGYYFVGGC